MKGIIQRHALHPGEILSEQYFEPLKLTVTEAAKKLLLTRSNLSAIINGRASISPRIAVRLATAFDTTPLYWLNMQANYDLWQVLENDKMATKVKMLFKMRP
jgi:addiction module HigA family antidote